MPPPERLAEQHHLVEPELVEHGHHVAGGGHEPAVLEGRRRVAGAVPPEVDPDRAVLVAQEPGQRVEHPGAEAVGVQEHQRRAVAAPVERADGEPVVLDGPPLRFVGRSLPFGARYPDPRAASDWPDARAHWVSCRACRPQQEPVCAVSSAKPRSSW